MAKGNDVVNGIAVAVISALVLAKIAASTTTTATTMPPVTERPPVSAPGQGQSKALPRPAKTAFFDKGRGRMHWRNAR